MISNIKKGIENTPENLGLTQQNSEEVNSEESVQATDPGQETQTPVQPQE